MIVRNTHGLPRAIVDSISNQLSPEERREGADISVTELIGPPRIKQLKDKYFDQVEFDASDRLHAFMGSAIHALIAKSPYSLSEFRMHVQWRGLERMWTITGQVDLYEDGIIWDFKPIRAAAVFDGPREEWVQQLNIYRMMAEAHGLKVLGLMACPYIRDYTPVERFRNVKYPPASMVAMEIPMWSREKTDAYVRYRLTEHEKIMPECTHDERWAKPHEYALMTSGMARAVALYKSKEDAEIQMNARKQANPNKKFWVVERQAESLRCKHYCDFWKWCDRGLKERTGDTGER